MEPYKDLSRTFRSNIHPYYESAWSSTVEKDYVIPLQMYRQPSDVNYGRQRDWLNNWNEHFTYQTGVMRSFDDRKRQIEKGIVITST